MEYLQFKKLSLFIKSLIGQITEFVSLKVTYKQLIFFLINRNTLTFLSTITIETIYQEIYKFIP